jgi:hypothetical protein
VEDLLLGVLVQISSIGYRRLGLTEESREDRDLEQTKLAIDTMKALTPVLAEVVPGELIRDFESSVANLQLAYATAASDMSGDSPRTRPDETRGSGEAAGGPDTERGSGEPETPD